MMVRRRWKQTKIIKVGETALAGSCVGQSLISRFCSLMANERAPASHSLDFQTKRMVLFNQPTISMPPNLNLEAIHTRQPRDVLTCSSRLIVQIQYRTTFNQHITRGFSNSELEKFRDFKLHRIYPNH